jgi:arsenite methyltransferase
VFMVNAYHHMPERAAYFANLARSLEPGGRLAVVESKPGGLHRVIGHATAPETITSELEAAGYGLVAEHTFLPRQGFLVFEQRQAAREG